MNPTPIKRRLAAILAADAVSYSRHMADDEEGTLRTLSGHRAIIDGLIASFDGRIVGTAGDSVLAEFGSSIDAVRCAVEIQQALATRNASLEEHDRLLFRIGINLGDVIVEGDDILGDGVNVAARLESIAEPGGVCISSSIYDQVTGKLNLAFADMGPQSLKNIGRPVQTYRLDRDGVPVRGHGGAQSTSAPRRVPLGAAVAAVVVVAVMAVAWVISQRPRTTDTAAGSRPDAVPSSTEVAGPVAGAGAAATVPTPTGPPASAPAAPKAPTAPVAAVPATTATQGERARPEATAPPAVADAAAAPTAPAPNLAVAPAAATSPTYSGGTADLHCDGSDAEIQDGRGTVRVAGDVVTVESAAGNRAGAVTARGRLRPDGALTLVVVGTGRGRGGRQGAAGPGPFSGRLENGRGTLTGPQGRCTLSLILN